MVGYFFFKSKANDYYHRDIEQLVDLWQEVIYNEEEYIGEGFIRTIIIIKINLKKKRTN